MPDQDVVSNGKNNEFCEAASESVFIKEHEGDTVSLKDLDDTSKAEVIKLQK